MDDNLSQWKEKYIQSLAEIQRLTRLIEDLQRQLQESIQGNVDLRKLLTDLQVKLDTLIAQSKKLNKRDHGNKTEKHNPRPATV